MKIKLIAIFSAFVAVILVSSTNAPATSRFGMQTEENKDCEFNHLKLPQDCAIFAAGGYSGRKLNTQIDQSGHQATQMDVTVNSPSRPVVLMLGAYEPTIWNIKWTPGTDILALFVSGYHRQVVAGIDPSIPILNSSHDNEGPCGHFYVKEDDLSKLNPMSRRVFGRPVDMVYPAKQGNIVIGGPISSDQELITSRSNPPESHHDKTAPLAGSAGLEDAIQKGLLREATEADFDAWDDAVKAGMPGRDVPPIAGQTGQERSRSRRFLIDRAYVVLKQFSYPAGLYGANSAIFFISKGAPRPTGNRGHSTVFDFNTLACRGPMCNR